MRCSALGYFRQPEFDKLCLRDDSSPSLGPSTGEKFWRTFIGRLCGPLFAPGLGMPGEDTAAAYDSMMGIEDDMRTSKGEQRDRVVIPPASAMEADVNRRAKPLNGKLTPG
jgi:hypothetical protein